MAVAGASVIVLLVGATLLIGGLALFVAMLIHPKTRWIALGLVGLVVLGMAVSYTGFESQRMEVQQHRSRLLMMQDDIARKISEAHEAEHSESHSDASHDAESREQSLAQMRLRVAELETQLAELGAHDAAAGQPTTPQQRFYSARVPAVGILGAVAVLVVVVLLVRAAPGLSLVGLGALAVMGALWITASGSRQTQPQPQPAVGGSSDPLPTRVETDQIVLTEEDKTAADADADAPDWVRDPAATAADHDSFRRVVETEPFLSREEAIRDADRLAAEAAVTRLSELVGEPLEATKTDELGFNPASWSQTLIKQRYTQELKTSVAPVFKSYAEVEISRNDLELMKASWIEAQQSKRVATVAQGGLGAFGLVALALGLLKLDQSTGQRYTKRLLIGAPAATIGLAAMLLALA